MKSYNHVFEQIIDKSNILIAIERSSVGKRERKDVVEVRADPEQHAEFIIRNLKDKTYKIPNHKLVEINDGITQKKRYIIKPHYKYEQIIHHAIVQAMEPIFMRGMYRYCCGSVPGRGSHFGKKYIEHFIRKNKSDIKYCLKMDVHHFFQSVSQEILKEKLQRTIHDKDALWLLFLMIDAYSDHEENGRKYGIPLGYYTSQWFANWYLQSLDHFIKEKLHVKCYVRYMDDMIIFGRNKKELHRVREEISQYLKNELELELKDNWQVFRFEYVSHKDGKIRGRPLDFMGFEFHRDRTVLRKSIMMKATRKATKIYKKKATWYDATQMLSYLGWFSTTDTYNCYQKYMKDCLNVKELKRKVSQHERRRRNVKPELQESTEHRQT